ncbi:MAG TPA: redoxin family protein [Candidatus Dormibacteraeota bacterium]|nr:redoxin family protein [Candidatus Dormibacteraeota bacterium]
MLWTVPHFQPPAGTLVVVAAGRTSGTLPSSALLVRQKGGSWFSLGNVAAAVPAAPDQHQLIATSMAAGAYDAIRLGSDTNPVSITVTAGQVEPVLVGIDGGRVVPGAVYAGNDQVNLGLGELSGKFVPIHPFELVDQAGHAFTPAQIAGHNVAIAAFHTTCHESCPLYTALFLQLQKRIPAGVMLVEVTTDPADDTPHALSLYANNVGASWTLATGTSDQVASFWKQFGVELSSGDTHTSSLALVDSHGYVRLVYRGVPEVGHDVPPSVVNSLSATGLQEMASGGDGWGAPDVLQALLTIGAPQPAQQASGGKAPAFSLKSTDGGSVSSSSLTGHPLVINFWRSDCPPCQAEMPLLDRQVSSRPGVELVLINWGQSSEQASAFLAGLGVHRATLLDADLSVGRAYGVSALPTTIFVRADGTIDRRQVGQLDDQVLGAELSILSTQ